MDTSEVVAATRPLSGRRVLVTRPPEQASDLSERLRELGADVIELPTIRIGPPPDPEALRMAARSLGAYDWLAFTSVNGVRRLLEAMAEVEACPSDAADARVAAIGPATADEALTAGFPPALVPECYRAEPLLEAILEAEGGRLEGRRILLPRAAGARKVLPNGLRAAGARVDEVAAYVTRPARESEAKLRALVANEEVDWITFTASSTVRAFRHLAGREPAPSARLAAIGPITAATAAELGLEVDVVAPEHTVAGLVRAMAAAERDR